MPSQTYTFIIDIQENASSGLSGMANSLGNIGSILAAGTILTGILNIVNGLEQMASAGVTAATDFQDSMTKIAALTNTTAQDVGTMSEGVLKLSTQVPVSAKDLGDALYYVVSAGFQGSQAMTVLDSSARAAAAGLGSTVTVADAVTSVLNAYKMDVGEASHVTDVMVAAVTAGKMAPADFAGALGRVIPIAAASGVSIEQVSAAMATMTRSGLSAEEAATALRGTLQNLEKPSKQTVDGLAAIGLTAGQVHDMIQKQGLMATLEELVTRTNDLGGTSRASADAMGAESAKADALKTKIAELSASIATNEKSLQLNKDELALQIQYYGEGDIRVQKHAISIEKMTESLQVQKDTLAADNAQLERLSSGTGKVTEEGESSIEMLGHIIPNVRALTGVLSAASSQAGAYSDVLGEMNDAQGRTDRAFQTSMTTWNNQIALLQNNLTALAIEGIGKILPIITPIVSDIAKNVPQWAAAIGNGLSAAFDLLTRPGALGAAALDLGTMVVGMLKTTNWNAIASDLGSQLGTALQSAGGLINAFANWFSTMNWGTVADSMGAWLGKALSDASSIANAIGGAIGGQMGKIDWSSVFASAGDVGNKLLLGFENLLGAFGTRIWAWMQPQITTLANNIVNGLNASLTSAAGSASAGGAGAWASLTKGATDAFTQMQTSIQTILGNLGGQINTALASLGGQINTILGDAIKRGTAKAQQDWHDFVTSLPVQFILAVANVVGAALNLGARIGEALGSKLKQAMQDTFAAVALIISPAITAIGAAVSVGFNTLAPIVVTAMNNVRTALQGQWLLIRNTISGAITALQGPFSTLSTLISGALTTASSNLRDIWAQASKIFSDTATAIAGPLNKALTDLPAAIAPLYTQILDFVNNVLQVMLTTWNNIVSAIQSVINWLNTLANTLNNLKLPYFLTHNSPSPFEQTLWGSVDALRAMQGLLPSTLGSLGRISAPMLGGAVSTASSGGSGGPWKPIQFNFYDTHFHGNQTEELYKEFERMLNERWGQSSIFTSVQRS